MAPDIYQSLAVCFLHLSVIKLHIISLELSGEASEDLEIDSFWFRNPSQLSSGCWSLCFASCTYLLLPSCWPQAPFFASILCFFFSPPSSLNFSASCPESPMRQILPAQPLLQGHYQKAVLPLSVSRGAGTTTCLPESRVSEVASESSFILRQISEVKGESRLCRPRRIQSPGLCYRRSPLIQTCLLLILYLEEIKRNNYLGVTFCHLYKAICTWDFASSRKNELNAKYFREKRVAGLLKINLKDLHVFWSYIASIKLPQI